MRERWSLLGFMEQKGALCDGYRLANLVPFRGSLALFRFKGGGFGVRMPPTELAAVLRFLSP